MSQQEYEHLDALSIESQQAEAALHREQELLTGGEAAWGYYHSHHKISEKTGSSHTHQSLFWTPIVRFALALFIGGTLFGFTLAEFASSIHTLSPAQISFPPLALPQIGGDQSRPAFSSNSPSQQFFLASGPVHLTIQDQAAGSIHIHTGDTHRVLVSETTPDGGTTNVFPLQSTQQGNMLTLRIGNQGDAAVKLEVTAPADTSLNVASDTATINFAGSLAPDGTYQLVTQTGSINLSLPDDSAFRLSNIVEIGDFTNDFGRDVVGNSPRADMELLAYNGSVAIQKS